MATPAGVRSTLPARKSASMRAELSFEWPIMVGESGQAASDWRIA